MGNSAGLPGVAAVHERRELASRAHRLADGPETFEVLDFVNSLHFKLAKSNQIMLGVMRGDEVGDPTERPRRRKPGGRGSKIAEAGLVRRLSTGPRGRPAQRRRSRT